MDEESSTPSSTGGGGGGGREKNGKNKKDLEDLLLASTQQRLAYASRASQLAMLMPGYFQAGKPFANVISSMALLHQAAAATAAASSSPSAASSSSSSSSCSSAAAAATSGIASAMGGACSSGVTPSSGGSAKKSSNAAVSTRRTSPKLKTTESSKASASSSGNSRSSGNRLSGNRRRRIISDSEFYERSGSPPLPPPPLPPPFSLGLGGAESSALIGSVESLDFQDEQHFAETYPGKSCGFCNLSERSVLGQGEIIKFKTELDVSKISKEKTPSDGDKSPKVSEKKKNLRKLTVSSSSEEMIDDLECVGYSEEPDINLVFENSGHFYCHLNCALWSEGVVKKKKEDHSEEAKENKGLIGVDTALLSSISSKCAYCKRFGASLKCASGSGKRYHWPCAAASGCYMEKAKYLIVGTDNLSEVAKLAEGQTYLYHNGETWKYGKVSELKVDKFENLLCCTVCGQHYFYTGKHVLITPLIRGGWQCQKCKWCQNCRQCNQDERFLLCDICDGAFHAHCLRPQMTTLPKTGWRCKRCRKCTDCGSRTPGSGQSSRWHGNYSVCDSCYQQRNKGLACPICRRAYRHSAQKEMMQCSSCRRHVHSQCDREGTDQASLDKKQAYLCRICKSGGNTLVTSVGGSTTPTLSGASSPISEDLCDDDLDCSLNGRLGLGKGKPLAAIASNNPKKRKITSGSSSAGIGSNSSASLLSSYSSNGVGGSIRSSNNIKGSLSSWKGVAGTAPPSTAASSASQLSGNKKRTAGDLCRKGRQPKVRGMVGLQRPTPEPGVKEDVEEENKMICISNDDDFVLKQDICVMCGSLGNDSEGRLIVCTQCGQCYHPHCVNVRVTKVILEKGWRCLDCTVCEGCGEKHDEGNLILCDECDISYHIYCMEPPLDKVPQGPWKCKWCAICLTCGANDPGYNSPWYENFSLCGPCHSLRECLICEDGYEEGELIMRCSMCQRWCHGECDSIQTEEDAEKCAQEEYSCQLCRPNDVLPPHLALPPPEIQQQHKSFPSPATSISPDFSTFSNSSFVVDGVVLSERGMSHLKSQMIEKEKAKRRRRGDRNVFDTIESVVSGSAGGVEDDDEEDDLMPAPPTPSAGSHKDGDRVYPLPDGTPPPAPEGFSVIVKDNGLMVLRKRRYRDLKKVGIGGFLAKSRSSKCNKSKDDAETSEANGEKPKRRPPWRPKKNKILVQYPEYIQDSFFGREFIGSKNDFDIDPSSILTDDIIPEDEDVDIFFEKSFETSSLNLGKEALAAVEELAAREEEEAKLKVEEERLETEAKIVKEKELKKNENDKDEIKKESEVEDKKIDNSQADHKTSEPIKKSTEDKKEESETEREALCEEDDLNLDSDLLPTDLFPDEMFSSFMDDDDDPNGTISNLDEAGNKKGDKKLDTEDEDSKKGNAALAAAIQDTLGPGFKLDSKDMDDIFKDMIDEGEPKDDPATDEILKGETEVKTEKEVVDSIPEDKPKLQSNQCAPTSSASIVSPSTANIPSTVSSQPSLIAEQSQSHVQPSIQQPSVISQQSIQKIPQTLIQTTSQQQQVIHQQPSVNVVTHQQPNVVLNQQHSQMLHQQSQQQNIQPQQQIMMIQQQQQQPSRPQLLPQRPMISPSSQQQQLIQQQQLHQQQLLQQQQQIRLQQQQQIQPQIIRTQSFQQQQQQPQQQQPQQQPPPPPPPQPQQQQQISTQAPQRFTSVPSPYHQTDYNTNSPQLPSPVFSSDSQSSWTGNNSGPNSVIDSSVPQSPRMPVGSIPSQQPPPPGALPQTPSEIPPPQSAQKTQLMKWESDEPLGDQATIAMILYANKNHPNLKADYPQWSDRIKQIAKIWKNLPNDKRHLYVQSARENRTANRMNRSSKKNVASNRVSSSPSTPSVPGSTATSLTSAPCSTVLTAPLHLSKVPTPPNNNPELQWKQQMQQRQLESQTMEEQRSQEPGLVSSGNNPNVQFRQPLPPRPGMRIISPHQFRPTVQQIDPRTRMVVQQRQQLVPSQQQNLQIQQQISNTNTFANQQQQQLVLQQQQQQQHQQTIQQQHQIQQQQQIPVSCSPSVSQSSPLLAQQLVGTMAAASSSTNTTVSTLGSTASTPQPTPAKANSDSQLKEALDGFEHSELSDLGVGEDDLLGMGDDFNILEFADALEEGDNNQTTIWDTLKEEEESKDAALTSSSPPSVPPTASVNPNVVQPQQQANKALTEPPPYRGPPPPYPGHSTSSGPKEQPLLLEDLLEQEKREQLQQQPLKQEMPFPGELGSGEAVQGNLRTGNPQQQQEGIRPQQPGIIGGPNFRGIRPTLPQQTSHVRQPMAGIQRWPARHPQEVTLQQRSVSGQIIPGQRMPDPGPHPALCNQETPTPPPPPSLNTTPPPQPPDDPKTEEDRQKVVRYEQWLVQQEQSINQQLKYYETEITKLRKQRKSLNSKQRTMRKNGNSLNLSDQGELERVTQGAAEIQKTLERIRKQSRQHSTMINDHKARKQRALANQQQQQIPLQQSGTLQQQMIPPQSSIDHGQVISQQLPQQQRMNLPQQIQIQRPAIPNATQLRMQGQQRFSPQIQQRMVVMQQQRNRVIMQQQQQPPQIMRLQGQHISSPQAGEVSPAVSSTGGQSPRTGQPSPHSLTGQPSPQSFGTPSPGSAVRPGLTSPMPSPGPGGMSPMRVPSQSPQPSMSPSPAYHHSGYPSSQSPHGPSPRPQGHDDNPFSPNGMQRPLNTVSPVSLSGSPSPVPTSGMPQNTAVRLGSPQPGMRPPTVDQMRLRFVRPVGPGKDMRPPLRGPTSVTYQQQQRMRQPVSPNHQTVRSPQPMLVQQRRPSSNASIPSPIIDRPQTPQTPSRTPVHTPSPQHETHHDQFQFQQQIIQQQQQQQQLLMMQQQQGNGQNNIRPSGWSNDNVGLKGGSYKWYTLKKRWESFIGLKGGSPIFTQSSDTATVTTGSSTVSASEPPKVIVMSSTATHCLVPDSSSSQVPTLQILTSVNNANVSSSSSASQSVPCTSSASSGNQPTPVNHQTIQRLPPSSVHQANIGVPGAYVPRGSNILIASTTKANPIQTLVINGPAKYPSVQDNKILVTTELVPSSFSDSEPPKTVFVISSSPQNITSNNSSVNSSIDFKTAVSDVKATLNLPCPVTVTDVLTKPSATSSTNEMLGVSSISLSSLKSSMPMTTSTSLAHNALSVNAGQCVLPTSVLQGGPPRMALNTSTMTSSTSLLSTVLSTNKPIRSAADISAMKSVGDGSSSTSVSTSTTSTRPNALLKQLLSSNSLPVGSQQQQQPSTSPVSSQAQLSAVHISTKSTNALEAQLDKPTTDSKFSQLPIPKRSLSSLASQIPQATPISTAAVTETKAIPPNVIQVHKGSGTSIAQQLSLPTQPVPQASLASQTSSFTSQNKQILTSQQKSFAIKNAPKPPNVTIIQSQQQNPTIISLTQQQPQQQKIIISESPSSQVLQQRLLQKQVLVPQNELNLINNSSVSTSSSSLTATKINSVMATPVSKTGDQSLHQSNIQQQIMRHQQGPPLTENSHSMNPPRQSSTNIQSSMRPQNSIQMQNTSGQRMMRPNAMHSQQIRQVRSGIEQQRPEMVRAQQSVQFTHPQGQQQFQQQGGPRTPISSANFSPQQRPPISPIKNANTRPPFEQTRPQSSLRLQIPSPGPQLHSQQPSPALTPRSDGGNEDTNDGNSSKGDTSFESTGGTPDFSNGVEPPQKVVKRRPSQQQKRRQSGGNKDGLAKKRARKGSKADETDYDSYMESVMHQLKSLPPVPAVEPRLSHCYNSCPIYGMGELPKTFGLDVDTNVGGFIQEGCYGKGSLKSEGDYYNTMPFGNDPPVPHIPSVKITSRGFYKQEFENAKKTVESEDGPPPSPDVYYSSSPEPEIINGDVEINSRDLESGGNRLNHNQSFKPCRGADEKIWFDLDPEDSEDEENAERLRRIDLRPKSPSVDVVLPIVIRPKPGQAVSFKIENNNIELDGASARTLQSFLPSRNGGTNKTVTLTLEGGNGCAKNILKVLNGLAKILKIEAPKQWLAEDSKYGPRDVFRVKGEGGKDLSPIDLQSVLTIGAPFCHHCEVVALKDMVKVLTESLLFLSKPEIEKSGKYLYFCNSDCYFQFASSRTKEINSESPVNNLEELIKLKEKLRHERLAKEAKCESGENHKDQGPKFKGTMYKNWTTQIASGRKHKQLNENELMQMMFKMGVTIMPPREVDDTRTCLFCHIRGDAAADGPARLLNFDVNKWVHLNCALWSEEVYETVSGALVNVETALKTGINLYCKVCEKNGATVKCFKVRCTNYYHVGCAAKDRTMFYKNKSIYCYQHIPKGEKEQELTTLAVFRRVFIDRDENRQAAKVMDTTGTDQYLMRIGSMIFMSVGQLLPHQLHNFHTKDFIYPIGYKIIRYYWSMVHLNKRTPYICTINEVNHKPEFQITVGEEVDGEKEKTFKHITARGAWLQVLERVAAIRKENDLVKVFPQYITGEDLFGLTETNVVKVLESLPGIESLTDYNFKYGRNPLLELPLAVNPSGCARAEPQMRTRVKRVHNFQRTTTTVSTGLSRAAKEMVPTLIGLETTGPYSKNFVQSKSSQYRKMKMEWRQNVVLARSRIQGLGLYAARDLEKHQMIIEYIGEIIRSELTDIREKYYESQNRGIYMFRLDDDRVLDATMCGGMARYINHSCDPSCVTETVEVDRDYHIIIFANRRICRGEELSYDYKFDFEDDNKIPCMCGAANCRKWMN